MVGERAFTEFISRSAAAWGEAGYNAFLHAGRKVRFCREAGIDLRSRPCGPAR